MISHKDIERALKESREWLDKASKEELRAFLLKTNPPIPGLDPPWEEMQYKKRRRRKK